MQRKKEGCGEGGRVHKPPVEGGKEKSLGSLPNQVASWILPNIDEFATAVGMKDFTNCAWGTILHAVCVLRETFQGDFDQEDFLGRLPGTILPGSPP